MRLVYLLVTHVDNTLNVGRAVSVRDTLAQGCICIPITKYEAKMHADDPDILYDAYVKRHPETKRIPRDFARYYFAKKIVKE